MGKDETLIAAIAAMSANGMIGLAGWLPWDIPDELAYFEEMVAGAALVVGRLTYESMEVVPVDTFVVSHREDLVLKPGCVCVPSVEAGLRAALRTGKPIFVIGGASVYAAAWPYCHRFHLTRIEAEFAGDTLFPPEIPVNDWPIVAESVCTLPEKKKALPVRCRFIEYAQPRPRPVPAVG
jgi:dihydrofolate reductase